MRRRFALLAVLAVAAGCGASGPAGYTAEDIKAAYYTVRDAGDAGVALEEYWVDDEYHSHANYVPREALEVCPLMQRANAPVRVDNIIRPEAAQPVGEYVVGPARDTDIRTVSVTQGALLFGTTAIADAGMKAVSAAMGQCPASYEVRGGPSPILGTYAVSSRPLETEEGWTGVLQQIAHTNPADDVYYEDAAHVVVQRANVILYFDVTHRKIIGERSDAPAQAEAVLKTVLARLG